MKKFPVWSAVMSVVGIVAGVFIMYAGIRPITALSMATMKTEQAFIYSGIACLGVALVGSGASKIGEIIGGLICDSVSESLARKRRARERAALFSQSTEIPVFHPAPIVLADQSSVWGSEPEHRIEQRPDRLSHDSGIPVFPMKPTIQSGEAYS